jgi:anti-sigma B factor antagonist
MLTVTIDRGTSGRYSSRPARGAFAMTSPVIPAPAVPFATTDLSRPPASGLPVARIADPVDELPPLTVAVDDRGDTAVLRARGEVDLLTVAELRAAVDAWLLSGVRTIVLDLRGVSFVDCAGVGMLADARLRARRGGVALRIEPGRSVARVAALLDLTGALGLDENP